jgi:hypothetical protein
MGCVLAFDNSSNIVRKHHNLCIQAIQCPIDSPGEKYIKASDDEWNVCIHSIYATQQKMNKRTMHRVRSSTGSNYAARVPWGCHEDLDDHTEYNNINYYHITYHTTH